MDVDMRLRKKTRRLFRLDPQHFYRFFHDYKLDTWDDFHGWLDHHLRMNGINQELRVLKKKYTFWTEMRFLSLVVLGGFLLFVLYNYIGSLL